MKWPFGLFGLLWTQLQMTLHHWVAFVQLYHFHYFLAKSHSWNEVLYHMCPFLRPLLKLLKKAINI